MNAWRARRWRRVALNLALSVLATLGGLTASGAFQRGTAAGPAAHLKPASGAGVAIPSSVKLLPIKTPDPAGGLPWGLRTMRTTRGLTCVEVGRVDYGSIGVLGIDGAFADDGRFHPLSNDVYDPFGCANTDAHGNGFLNVAIEGVPASGLTGDIKQGGGCEPSGTGSARTPGRSACPAADLREVYYGLLGPDAISVTHRADAGKLERTPTVGPDGAYLLVLRQPENGCPSHAMRGRSGGGTECPHVSTAVRGGPRVPPGAITAVTYRDGHTCHVAARTRSSWRGSCRPVGYVAPARRRLTAAQVSSPIHVRMFPGTSFCEKRASPETTEEAFRPCGAGVPAGYRRIAQPSALVQISFRSRIAIHSERGRYLTTFDPPRSRRPGCDDGGSMGDALDFDIEAGQLLIERQIFPIDCPGVVHGTVRYVSTGGPSGPPPILSGGEKRLLVGRFSFEVP